MKKYNLIFLKSDRILLSKKQYSDWKEIQEEYEDYMASMDFNSLVDLEEYIMIDYKVTSNNVKEEVNKIIDSFEDSIVMQIL